MRNMQFYIGRKRFTLFGGPYTERPKTHIGVKMAKEINRVCDINIPTEDFDVPRRVDLISGMAKTIIALYKNKPVYVGCMAGRGRTGLFMACMVKMGFDYSAKQSKKLSIPDPIDYVRRNYYAHAVETNRQEYFVTQLDTTKLQKLLWRLDNIPLFKRLPESWILKLAKCT